MPELPEVETVKRSLEEVLKNRWIEDVEIRNPVVIRHNNPEEFQDRLLDRKFTGFYRYGKYLLFEMTHLNPNMILEDFIVHLGMTGALIYGKEESLPEKISKHILIKFTLDDGKELLYSDIRRFGSLFVVDDETLNYGDLSRPDLSHIRVLHELGPDPLEEGSKYTIVRNIAKYHSKCIRDVLLDQTVLSGVGNIYANEVLHLIRKRPYVLVGSLSTAELSNMVDHLVNLLNKAIEQGGTSVKDFVDGFGREGKFQHFLRVYDRDTCGTCGAGVERIKLNGRMAYYCPKCQKE